MIAQTYRPALKIIVVATGATFEYDELPDPVETEWDLSIRQAQILRRFKD